VPVVRFVDMDDVTIQTFCSQVEATIQHFTIQIRTMKKKKTKTNKKQ
jgi:hypothetical protein